MFQMWPHKQKHVAPTVQKLWKFISERLLGKRVTNIYASKYYGKHIYSRHSLNLRLFGLLLVQQLRITDSFGQALCKKIPGKEEERGRGCGDLLFPDMFGHPALPSPMFGHLTPSPLSAVCWNSFGQPPTRAGLLKRSALCPSVIMWSCGLEWHLFGCDSNVWYYERCNNNSMQLFSHAGVYRHRYKKWPVCRGN